MISTLPLALLASRASFAAPAPPATVKVELPPPGELRYWVYLGDMNRDLKVAEIGYRLDHDGSSYEVTTQGKAVGMIAMFYSGVLIQSSVGRVGPGGLLPQRYSERRGNRPERVVKFDQARQKMIGLGEPPEVDLLPATQDRLSIFYQLGLMVRSDPTAFREGERLRLPLASLKRIDVPTFTVMDTGPVKTPRGTMSALHLTVRNEADPRDREIDVWLGSELSMLPVRIRFEDSDGKIIDQVLAATG